MYSSNYLSRVYLLYSSGIEKISRLGRLYSTIRQGSDQWREM